MADEPAKAMGGGCFGGLLGASIGVAIGGFVGPSIMTSGNNLRNDRDPMAKELSTIFDGCFGFLGMLIGARAGGIIGGIGGSVAGAGLDTRAAKRRDHAQIAGDDRQSASLLESSSESIDQELARLKERVAELEATRRPKPTPDRGIRDDL